MAYQCFEFETMWQVPFTLEENKKCFKYEISRQFFSDRTQRQISVRRPYRYRKEFVHAALSIDVACTARRVQLKFICSGLFSSYSKLLVMVVLVFTADNL